MKALEGRDTNGGLHFCPSVQQCCGR